MLCSNLVIFFLLTEFCPVTRARHFYSQATNIFMIVLQISICSTDVLSHRSPDKHFIFSKFMLLPLIFWLSGEGEGFLLHFFKRVFVCVYSGGRGGYQNSSRVRIFLERFYSNLPREVIFGAYLGVFCGKSDLQT